MPVYRYAVIPFYFPSFGGARGGIPFGGARGGFKKMRHKRICNYAYDAFNDRLKLHPTGIVPI